jgi:hypothetical protein
VVVLSEVRPCWKESSELPPTVPEMSSPSAPVQLAHRQVRTLTWPSVPSGTGASNDLSIVEDDLEYCNAPCRHHPRSDKYPTVGEGKHIPNLQKLVSSSSKLSSKYLLRKSTG